MTTNSLRLAFALATWSAFAVVMAKPGEPTRRDERHWPYEPVGKVEPPADPDGWSAHPIDRFLRAKQRDAGLSPAGPADQRTLIRRATFDLTGLPPTPEEIDAVRTDSSPN